MGKHDRLSRDQKRKAKLRKRAQRSCKHEPLAYTGRKYKTDAYAQVFFRTEVGIHESYVMCDRELTDDEVEEPNPTSALVARIPQKNQALRVFSRLLTDLHQERSNSKPFWA